MNALKRIISRALIGLVILLPGGCNFPSPDATQAALNPSPSPTSVPTIFLQDNVAQPTPIETPCLASGDQTDINALLSGAGSEVWLCQGAVFELTGPVVMNADGQQISTVGLPTDDHRAVLRIVSASVTSAVMMRDHSNAVLSNVIVDGNRPNLGQMDGDALIYAGGFSSGQIIRDNVVENTRSWSSIHLIEGGMDQPCRNALVKGNKIGPAGTSDEWADGISLACRDSIVRDNLVIDATDGGIVIFGAPGSLIENNLIRAETRTLLGGINMVDHGPYNGDYTGTIVRDNIIDASGAVIRIGLGMGPRVWICLPAGTAKDTIHGGTVTGNTLTGIKMQFGFAIDGVTDWTATGNFDQAEHHGVPSQDCGGRLASAPAGFLYSPEHAQGTFQEEFQSASLDLALWAIVSPRPGE